MTEKFKEVQENKKVLIVNYKKGIKTEDFKEAKKGLKFKKEEKLKFTEQDILVFDTEEEALKVKEKLEKRKNVDFVEFDKMNDGRPASLTNEPDASSYNYHMTANPYIPNDNFDWLKLKQINDNMGAKPDAVLAIIDDSIRVNHPDLAGKFVDGYSAHQDLRQSQGGVVNILNQTHGTLVAGMAAAITNNGKHGSSIGGIFNNVKILPISVYDPTGEYYLQSSFIRGINHAISRGVVAINMSWYRFSQSSLEYAFQSAYNAGIANFVCAGNDSTDLSMRPTYPASHTTTYSIGNVQKNMTLNPTSNYGKIDFVGNGSNVIALAFDFSFPFDEGGTSSASPHVASIYTAMKAVSQSALTRDQIIGIMADTAYPINGNKHLFGHGYPNAVEAIRIARMNDGSFVTTTHSGSVATNKSWSVTMSSNVDKTKLGGVYVLSLGILNSANIGKEHPVNVTVSGSVVTVTPRVNYTSGEMYVLIVSDLYNTSGVKLSANSRTIFAVS